MVKEIPQPLTDEEVRELDSYGELHGLGRYPTRCIELWEREILWGKVNPTPKDLRRQNMFLTGAR